MIAAMPERPLKIVLAGKEIAVTDVPVESSTEKPVEYTLEDGTVMRVQYTANSIVRVDGQTDLNGDPLYLVRNATAVTLLKAGDHAKQTIADQKK